MSLGYAPASSEVGNGVLRQPQHDITMNSKQPNPSLNFLILSLLLIGVGCRTPKTSTEPLPPPPPPINVIKIGNFQCENEVTAQAVRNVFIEILGRNSIVKIVKDGDADVVIEGTITYSRAGSSMESLGAGPNWAAGKGRASVGEYVSGITALVTRNGEILVSKSFGQVISKGGELLPPEYVARQAADRLLGDLYRSGLKRR